MSYNACPGCGQDFNTVAKLPYTIEAIDALRTELVKRRLLIGESETQAILVAVAAAVGAAVRVGESQ